MLLTKNWKSTFFTFLLSSENELLQITLKTRHETHLFQMDLLTLQSSLNRDIDWAFEKCPEKSRSKIRHYLPSRS